MNPQLQAAFKRALRFGRWCGNNQINQSGQSQSDERGTKREILSKMT